MSQSGKSMDKYTKEYQSVEKSNPTISYKETGCGTQAIITGGGTQYISDSHNSKEAARADAVALAQNGLDRIK